MIDFFVLIKVLMVAIPVLVCASYLAYAERRWIARMQDRIGPNRTGWWGLGQPLADALKLLLKRPCIPDKGHIPLFLSAPMIAAVPAMVTWAVVPFHQDFVLADLPYGLLFLYAIGSLSVYGVLIAGWSSRSRYGLLGALRASAQMIAYEIPISFSLVGVILMSDSARLIDIVQSQQGSWTHWHVFPLLPLFLIYWISSMAETHRLPFDVSEGESELVAGFHVEYSGMGFAIFFLSEYANMALVSAITTLCFFGGWMAPIPCLDFIPGFFWFMAKTSFFLLLFIHVRGSLPRYRYDQIMQLTWKVFVPIALFWLMMIAFFVSGQAL